MNCYRTAFKICMLTGALCAAQTFSTLDYPDATATRARGVGPTGNIVGAYVDASGRTHGFLYSGGTWTSIDCEGARLTVAVSTNSLREIVGTYQDGDGIFHPYYMGEPGGRCFPLDPKGANGRTADTAATGINDAGEIVGQFEDQNGRFHGFLFRGEIFLTFDLVDGPWNGAFSITPRGDILGHLQATGGRMKGWVMTKNRFEVMEFPPAEENNMSCVFGGNSKGEFVGHYQRRTGPVRGFLYQNGRFDLIDFPDATATDVRGINDDGLIVGMYTAKDGKVHAFTLVR